jgi:hypothetical protein
VAAVPARIETARNVADCGFSGREITPYPFSSHRVLPSSVANSVARVRVMF